jgi:predicted nucleic acid-binding protein
VWKLCETNQVEGYISALSIPNIVYILRKELTPEKTKDVIQQILLIFNVAELKSEDLKKASEMLLSDYEDAVQIACATRIHADYIVTRNVKDFKESKVLAITPSAWLENII